MTSSIRLYLVWKSMYKREHIYDEGISNILAAEITILPDILDIIDIIYTRLNTYEPDILKLNDILLEKITDLYDVDNWDMTAMEIDKELLYEKSESWDVCLIYNIGDTQYMTIANDESHKIVLEDRTLIVLYGHHIQDNYTLHVTGGDNDDKSSTIIYYYTTYYPLTLFSDWMDSNVRHRQRELGDLRYLTNAEIDNILVLDSELDNNDNYEVLQHIDIPNDGHYIRMMMNALRSYLNDDEYTPIECLWLAIKDVDEHYHY